MRYLTGFILLLLLILPACKKTDNGIKNNDKTAVYKGVLTGNGDASNGHIAGAVIVLLPSGEDYAQIYVNFSDGPIDSANAPLSIIGEEKKFTISFGTASGGETIQFSTGLNGNSPTLSATTQDYNVPHRMYGVISLETSTEPISVFFTHGSSSTSVFPSYNFIKIVNTISGYERFGTYASGNIPSSPTTGQFTNNTNISASGSLYKYIGIYNPIDSTISGTYYNVVNNIEIGEWTGWRIY
ncbi:MAG: hypothetical protein WBO44_12570 [Saprospiraceae bacterium]